MVYSDEDRSKRPHRFIPRGIPKHTEPQLPPEIPTGLEGRFYDIELNLAEMLKLLKEIKIMLKKKVIR